VDGRAITERLLKDLTRLGDRVWLVADDVHALGPAEAGRHLELLVVRGPLEASSCPAQELTAPDTEHPVMGLACHDCWHGEGTASRTGLQC
jgi:hypothetical protein